jgi:hypothetical protein
VCEEERRNEKLRGCRVIERRGEKVLEEWLVLFDSRVSDVEGMCGVLEM